MAKHGCLIFIITTITIAALTWPIGRVYSLVCANTYDGPDVTNCTVSSHNESRCFKSVSIDWETVGERKIRSVMTDYGCFSGGDNILAHLQCHPPNGTLTAPIFVKCCKGQDLCNYNLPDPDPEKDPRWIINDPEEPYFNYFTSDNWRACLFGAAALALICALLWGLSLICNKCTSRSTKNSRSSICSTLKTDIEKYQQYVVSSSISSHSYSISDDLCYKIPEPTNDESLTAADLTSGQGERMLSQRTMARAVGSGSTHHVGEGRFGRVFRGVFHGDDVAVKAFKTIDQDSWQREDNILRHLNHENIVRFIASETTSLDNSATEIWMFLEYCPCGSLCDYLDSNEILGPQQAIKILFSIINGLNYLHEDYAQASKLYKPSIAHRDIKSKNILMKTPDSCCIADFGHALIKVDEDRLDYGKYQHIQVGTIRYMAPEILKPNQNLNYRHFSTFAQADLYQYGLILWEVCHRTALDILHPAGTHKLPYDGVVPPNPSILDMIKIVCEDQYRPPKYDIWEKYPAMKRLADLMVECWRPNSKARMETLGVKKKMKEMYDLVNPTPLYLQQNVYRSDRSKLTDATL